MRKKLTLLYLGILSLVGFSSFGATDPPFAELLKKLEEFTKKYTQEKVYLHLDKPYYALGDDIWFKAYVVDVKNSAPTTISNILYVELIDDRDSITTQIKLPIEDGTAIGDFELTDPIKEGNYRIRAYTKWMRNADADFFFDKTIKIGNSFENSVLTKVSHKFGAEGNNDKVNSTIQFNDKDGKSYANTEVNYEVQFNNKNIFKGKQSTNTKGEVSIVFNNPPSSSKNGKIIATLTVDKKKITKTILLKSTSSLTDVQFFPEGGSLVEGLTSKIGIKAVNANGLGENISGSIIDNDGTEVLKFETTYLGMGSLVLNPFAGKTYTAKVKFANGSEKTLALPKIEKSGYSLSINNTDSVKVAIKVMLSPDLLNTGELQLIAHHNGNVYFTGNIPTSKQLASITVSKKDMLSGIVQFTLFNSANIPVAERIIFANNVKDKIDLTLGNLKPSYTKRAKVELAISAKNNAEPVEASFSVAITNTNAISPDLANESNILTTLLLTSDLAGFVEKPNSYFLNQNEKTLANLDHLLLTQGWRKINWQQVMADQQSLASFEAEKYLKISGKITKGAKPVAKGKVSIFSTSSEPLALEVLSNEKGEFNFDELTFNDSTKFVVHASTDKGDDNVQIELDLVPGQIVTLNKNNGDVEVNVSEKMISYLKQNSSYLDEQYKKGLLNNTINLKEVNVAGLRTLAPNSQNLNGAGRADFIVTAKDLENTWVLSQYLAGAVPGVRVSLDKNVFIRNEPVNIILDGMLQTKEFKIDDIAVQDIGSIEVLKTIGYKAIYGQTGFNPILVITTKRGGQSEVYHKPTPGMTTHKPKGYYNAREFYSPKYDVEKIDKPDLRSTVYWNPNLIADETGKATFDYFNTDVAGTYRIVIEGIDFSGNLARTVYTYEVK